MKKGILFLQIFILLSISLLAQNSTVSAPDGAILVPGTKQLYTTAADEISRMMRSPAISACEVKGDGWRLPTLGELQTMYSHRYEMDFGESTYWSGDKVRGEFKFYAVNFLNGRTIESNYDKSHLVRCVWTPAEGQQVEPAQEAPKAVPAPQNQQNNAVGEKQQQQQQNVTNEKQPQPKAADSVAISKNITSPLDNIDEAPYRNAFGIIIGNMMGFSYKLLDRHFAFSIDLAVKTTIARGETFPNYYFYYYYGGVYGYWDTPWTLEVNFNFLRQDQFYKGLYGIIGGGPSIGYCMERRNILHNGDLYFDDCGKAGLGLLIGLEYNFNFPLSIQLDFRPACSTLFNDWLTSVYFDWGINLSMRFRFVK